tara:strand:+ start:86 stop:1522 length:1437 start_codon:yes stop_codon:yes gene_type:complete
LLIGIVFFLLTIIKRIIKINFLGFAVILFFFCFIFYDNGNNVDSAVYHIQTIKWANLYKIVFGLSNLDRLYSLNSTWHIFLSVFKFKINSFDTIYVINILPLTILFYEIFFSKDNDKKISYLTLYLSGVYLIFFAFLHPFKNGVIFNQYGNPEVDTVSMIFFILSFYFFLKCIEENKEKYFNLLLISSIICITTKITYSGVIIFPIYIFIIEKKYFSKLKILYFSIFFSFIWFVRNFILTSCFVYPVKFTCLNTNWYYGDQKLDQLVNLTKGFSRDTRLREKYTDFEHTIYSWDWFIPWFNDYFLNTAMLKITSIILIVSLILYLISKLSLKEKNKKKNHVYFLIFAFLIHLSLWLQAPEIRFGFGLLIMFPCFFLAAAIHNIKLFNFMLDKKIYISVLIMFFILLSYKNQISLNYNNIKNPYVKNWDYSNAKSLGKFNGYEIFTNNWKCADFENICVNRPKKNYNINENFGYLFFLK